MTQLDLPYVVLDVFAAKRCQGNQLTVVDAPADLDPAIMQQIANEANHSETTFILGRQDDGAYRVRIFTPRNELPFAGHPTLGTAWVLGQRHGFPVTLALNAGHVPVAEADGVLTMRQPQPEFGDTVDAELLGRALGVPVDEPGQIVGTGNPVVLVRVRDSDALRKATLDERTYLDGGGPSLTGVYVFTLDNDHAGFDAHARFFAPFVGIVEDAATGSAAGPLVAWVAKRHGFDATRSLRISQGSEMGRPSVLETSCRMDGDEWDIQVGGCVVHTATGTFHVDA